MLLLVAVACVFAGGVWMVVSAMWPAPRGWRVALDGAQRRPRRGRPAFVSADGYQPTLVAVDRVAGWSSG